MPLPNDIGQQTWVPPIQQDMTLPVGSWPEGRAFGDRAGGPAVWSGQQVSGSVPTRDWSPPPPSGAENYDPEAGK